MKEEEEEQDNVGTLQIIASCGPYTSGGLTCQTHRGRAKHVGTAAGGLEEAMIRRDRWMD